MDVKDVYKKKLEMSLAITALVNQFQKETGCKVRELTVRHRPDSISSDQPSDVYETSVDAVLP